MARACSFAKLQTTLKFSTRNKNRCKVCGRARSYYRKFELCRICFRIYSLRGEVPGVIKASW